MSGAHRAPDSEAPDHRPAQGGSSRPLEEVAADVVLARVAWSRLVEPGDAVAGALVEALGPVDALAWLREVAMGGDLLGGPPTGAGCPVGRLVDRAAGGTIGGAASRLDAAVRRWSPRLDGLEPARDLAALERRGGRLLVPEGEGWPGRLADLGPTAPHALWVLGDVTAVAAQPAAAVIGARAATTYGEHVAGEMSAGLGDAGVTVISGGAYGIDAVAHRAALSGGRPTVAVLAGGVDRFYPAGNARLLAAITESGAVVSEVPPGAVPSRSRFLQRNRVIAALAGVTVVVEAAWRSGTLSTAAHAARLLRPVGAVPGPVTSALSAGCHRLLREGAAVCVTDAAEVLELLQEIGVGEPADDRRSAAAARGALDDVAPGLRAVLEAVPVRGVTTVARLARVAGAGTDEVRAALGRLEIEGHVVRDGDSWARAWKAPPARAPGRQGLDPREPGVPDGGPGRTRPDMPGSG